MILIIAYCCINALGQELVKNTLPNSEEIEPGLEKNILSLVNKQAKQLKSNFNFTKVIFTTKDWKIYKNKKTGIIQSRERSANLISKNTDGKCSLYYTYFYQLYKNGEYQEIEFNFSVLTKKNVGQGQQCSCPNLNIHDIVKDSIVAKFNRNDYKGIYALGDSSFKASVSENDLISFLQNYAILGKILSDSLIVNGKENNEYRLQFTRKSLKLILGVQNEKSFSNFGLDLFRLPPERTRDKFLSDNPLLTSLDSVVQNAVTNYMSNKNISGISIGIIKNGTIHSYNFGEIKKGSNKLPNNNTIYEIGSISKTFTGILLANAVIEGKLKLEDDIRKYLLGDYPNLQYAGSPIQIVHLANHTSRIPSRPIIEGSNKSPMDENYTENFDDKMLRNILNNISIDTLPGTRREYSNFAVSLLGTILEKVYNMSYEQILFKYICEPYKMTQTKINLTKKDFKHFAQGYSMDGTLIPYWINPSVNPSGGIRSTVSDMLLYMKEQLNVSNKATTLSHKLTFGTEKNGKGLLWGIDKTKSNNNLRWSHDGSTDGFSSLIWIMPELNSGIVLLTNNGDFYDETFNNQIFKTIYKNLVQK